MEDIEQENTTSHRYYVSLTNKLKEKGIIDVRYFVAVVIY